MANKYTEPTPSETNVISAFLSNNDHVAKASTAKRQRDIKMTGEKSFQQMTFNNKKAAAKTQRENQEFGMAVNLAALISEIKLLLHYKTMVEKILEVRAEVDAKSEQRYHEMLADQRNPFPVTLPQAQQSPADYKKNVLDEANIFLAALSDKQSALENSIKENWGANTWQEGLKIQLDDLHEKMDKRIENYEFLNVVETADGGKINISKIDPEIGEKARAAFREVNDALRDFLNERPPPSPAIYEPFDIVQGVNAPEAPPTASRAVIFGEQAPQAPGIDTQAPAQKKIISHSQEATDREIFLINELLHKGFNKVDPALIGKNEVEVNAETKAKINVNSLVRLAVRYSHALADDIKKVEDKAQKFVDDSHLLKGIKHLVENAKKEVVKLEAELQLKISPVPRPR
jgi:hypothetical protein